MMADYIRREDALKALYNDYAYAAMDVIKRLPAADVAEVLRCEKCLYRSQYANDDGFYQCGMIQCADEHCALVPLNFGCIAGVKRGAKMNGGANDE
mgnify:CR=1 FL=1